ncbi:hypothetical protein RCO28_34430 [Streptomyces sp. LHD-70]|uniref:hypothetical protein n=1 Tax=Streptomyces sp. LHD-70 TaxID=3072140 RepID=UPI00280D5B0A|nr:hypothetical protein [Streptomyces sp. LHD-70]MDQ8707530.1 hypothetical protein [Streptomyces sp. LHD-70]
MLTRYRYRCSRCGTSSATTRSRQEAKDEGHRHRKRMHGGHHPDGELIQEVPWTPPDRGSVIAAVVIAVLIVFAILRNIP